MYPLGLIYWGGAKDAANGEMAHAKEESTSVNLSREVQKLCPWQELQPDPIRLGVFRD